MSNDLFEKQEGIKCAREQIGSFSNLHEINFPYCFYLTSFRYRELLKRSPAVIEYFSFTTLVFQHFSPKFSVK